MTLISTPPWTLCTSRIPLHEHTFASWVIKVTTHSCQSSKQISRLPSLLLGHLSNPELKALFDPYLQASNIWLLALMLLVSNPWPSSSGSVALTNNACISHYLGMVPTDLAQGTNPCRQSPER